jgi:hypothetical protein
MKNRRVRRAHRGGPEIRRCPVRTVHPTVMVIIITMKVVFSASALSGAIGRTLAVSSDQV